MRPEATAVVITVSEVVELVELELEIAVVERVMTKAGTGDLVAGTELAPLACPARTREFSVNFWGTSADLQTFFLESCSAVESLGAMLQRHKTQVEEQVRPWAWKVCCAWAPPAGVLRRRKSLKERHQILTEQAP
jgi:hypothetical protein